MGETEEEDRAAGAWRGFATAFGLSVAGFGLAVIGFVAVVDPYGLRVGPSRPPGALMDGNQRFMYPQVARSRLYDAAVFGSSTVRLLDPDLLGPVLGGRFANLAMNAATPFEQTALARVYLRHATPKSILFGIDTNWCAADADTKRLTFRPFPAWLYADGTPWNLLRQVNGQSVATAARVLLHRWTGLPARLRGDGYAVFTPPEASYNAARAAAYIHGGPGIPDPAALEPPPDPVAAPMPALDWLEALLADLPSETLRILAFMPVHVAAQGLPGTAKGAREAACKARVAEIGARHGATVVDFRIPSPVTTDDTRYWDALHYRLPVAGRIVTSLGAALATGADDPNGFYRVLTPPR
ncbi:hypothetical protein PMNALOAF_1103 [Methylobacterium adhaesivum]|jgi:hypothetical protein|uniref:SGNH/GDSL hydrolase family protein n=1 Tax=Methylobacterium adhaesivum TaxID=333297 RepID=A0ABT8BGT6_9HYPH|nr:hypothetical protein [Methylobacterium adhaesivum]MDN3590750.1 hypothetical protein [Methylobacterium adhaesivum]GJD29862.1 hypothetical protein PMNALOAF_1103 [Methylobacterium adhaesivum]